MTGICIFSPSWELQKIAHELRVFECFGVAEARRIEGISKDAARDLSLGGLIALKKLVDEFNLSSRDLTISRDAFGKPHFDAQEDIHFSISHTVGVSVAALSFPSKYGIGVDIERIDKSRNIERISERFFSCREKLKMSEASNAEFEFYKIWTAKEALIKLRGEGMPLIGACDTVESEENGEYCFLRYLLTLGEEEYILTFCSSLYESLKVLYDEADIKLCVI